MAWDWTFVFELAVGIGLGVGFGGYWFAFFLRFALLEIVGHPTARKLANAADRISGDQGGGSWWGRIVGGLADRFLNSAPAGHGGGAAATGFTDAELVVLNDGRKAWVEKR